jgi:hypothetical protein
MHVESGSRAMKAIILAAILLLGAATLAAHAAGPPDISAHQSVRQQLVTGVRSGP